MFWLLIQFLPLSIFVWIARSHDFSSIGWALAFEVGGVVALAETLLLSISKTIMNRLILAANLFLILGAAGFFLDLEWLTTIYGQMQESALFACVLIVGAMSTAFSPSGFLEVRSDPRRVRLYSLLLLTFAVGSFVLSIAFRGNVWLSGTAPFVLLIVVRRVLRNRLLNSAASN